MEALYQALSGAGYDMNCDGVYDAETDVLPFIASAADPFGGTAGEARRLQSRQRYRVEAWASGPTPCVSSSV